MVPVRKIELQSVLSHCKPESLTCSSVIEICCVSFSIPKIPVSNVKIKFQRINLNCCLFKFTVTLRLALVKLSRVAQVSVVVELRGVFRTCFADGIAQMGYAERSP